MSEIFFLKRLGKTCWSMKECQSIVENINEFLHFVYAWSAIFWKRKHSFLKLVKKSKTLKSVSEIMKDYWPDRSDVGKASKTAVI